MPLCFPPTNDELYPQLHAIVDQSLVGMAHEQVRSGPKVPKIRLSCDSCQRSKIRCSQERPACRRCLKHGIECIYSPSRRAGRPRIRRASAVSQSPPSPPPAPTATAQSTPPQEHQTVEPAPVPSRSEPERCSPLVPLSYASPPRDDTINVASARPEAAAVPTPISSRFFGQSPVPPADNHDHDASFSALTNLGVADSFSPMFPGVGSNEPSFGFDFLLTPLDGLALPSKTTPRFDSLSLSNSSPSAGTDGPGPMVPDCDCSITLLDKLAQSQRAQDQYAEQLASIASAVSKSRPLLTACCRVLSCSQCAPRFSSILMVCEALDRVSVALDMGHLWDGVGNDGQTSCAAISTDLAQDGSPLRCGGYSVRGGDRRIVLRVLIVKHLTELQAIMSKLQSAVDYSTMSKSPLQKTCADLVCRFGTKLSGKINLFKTLL